MKRLLPGIEIISLLIGILFLISSCNTDASGQYAYHMPVQIQDEISIGKISEVGLDTTLIFRLLNKIKSGRYEDVHSLLIYKDGKLVLEEYFAGHQYVWENPKFQGEVIQWHRDSIHNLMSDTKSVTSALVGIAIKEGFIQNEHESVFEYLPDYEQFKNQGREKILIEHLLTMTSGLEGNEWTSSYKNLENPIIKLWMVEDPIMTILDRPMVAEPGSYFSYWGGNNILLGEILKNATGMEVHSFAQKYLFEPLSIEKFEWPKINDGPLDAAGGLEMTPRAMAKVGILFLNNGKWKDQQILSEEWIEKSSTPYRNNLGIRVPGLKTWRHGYTYGWWTKSWEQPAVSTFFAGGWGGQNIMVVPEEDMVVVFTGGNYAKIPPPKKIMDKFIIPALGHD